MSHARSSTTLAILYLTISVASAQPETSFGLKLGPNSASQAHEYRVPRYGFAGGASAAIEWPVLSRFLFGGQLEILYTPRGAKVVLNGGNQGQSRLHYLDLALAARPAASFGKATAYLLLGASVNLLMSAYNETALGAKHDITNDLHRFDVSLLGGAGLALQLPTADLGPFRLGTLSVEARYDIGLFETALSGGFKHRTSSLMLGLSFVLGSAPKATPSQAVTASQ